MKTYTDAFILKCTKNYTFSHILPFKLAELAITMSVTKWKCKVMNVTSIEIYELRLSQTVPHTNNNWTKSDVFLRCANWMICFQMNERNNNKTKDKWQKRQNEQWWTEQTKRIYGKINKESIYLVNIIIIFLVFSRFALAAVNGVWLYLLEIHYACGSGHGPKTMHIIRPNMFNVEMISHLKCDQLDSCNRLCQSHHNCATKSKIHWN